MRNPAKCIASCLAAALLVAAIPAAAGAASRVIQPEQLQPMSSTANFARSPKGLLMSAGTASFFAPLKKLPVGARITGAKAWTSAIGGPSGTVTVYRVKSSEIDLGGANTLMTIDLSTATQVWEQISETATGPASNRVARGYRYFVSASLNNTSTLLGAITVSYVP